jgi:hypothetical protein
LIQSAPSPKAEPVKVWPAKVGYELMQEMIEPARSLNCVRETLRANDTVYIYNMRYLESVEDRVHQLLSTRLQNIFSFFGQFPDVLEDVRIDIALGKEEQARKVIDSIPEKHPFDIRYEKIEHIDWESCAQVLSNRAKKEALMKGW